LIYCNVCNSFCVFFASQAQAQDVLVDYVLVALAQFSQVPALPADILYTVLVGLGTLVCKQQALAAKAKSIGLADVCAKLHFNATAKVAAAAIQLSDVFSKCS